MREMTSQVNWALLGLVIKRPGYGYELVKRFERDYGDVLPLKSESHIYTALNELERRGFIEKGIIRSAAARQPKPSYRATANGTRAYCERLMSQVCEDRRQSRLFVRQLAALEREPAEALQVIARYAKACVEEAGSLPTAVKGLSRGGAISGLAARLISEESRLVMQARFPWVKYAQAEFLALGEGPPHRR